MRKEKIKEVFIDDSGELFLTLESEGDSDYQYVYREASAVYWDEEKNAFKSSKAPGNWSYVQWFCHIIDVVKSGVSVELQMHDDIDWSNMKEVDIEEIVRIYNREEIND